ncbi:UTP--glucose-1-phosphate uridylyltransferase GalU [Methylohalobius crimeensis]|uniref:UTP--glucose-1-phosphate uridylyltransferase GalU n=1 Tax=Methylohalobius crimeensis TaxID=244365 RepID=UPI0003B5656B|nr:UTP--glucose-1-phosphate uridylyltransferase GalU [Methylohalobius crimeensis]
MKIKKAVFPVAGLGTRFLPATKASPKEMLPVVDKPLIQYAVEEAAAAGIELMVFVTGRNKTAISNHFDKAYELETELEHRGKIDKLELVRNIPPAGVNCVYIRQAEALGLGHAVLCAKPIIGNEPFAVLLADDLIENNGRGCMEEMVEIYESHGRSVLAVEEIPLDASESYGVVAASEVVDNVTRVEGIVEKPKPEEAPSNLGVVGRYILTPRIFDLLETVGRGAGGEIQLTDAIAQLLEHELVYAHRFSGKRYDCGAKLGYLEATVDHALQHPELAEDFRAYLKSLNL